MGREGGEDTDELSNKADEEAEEVAEEDVYNI